MHDSINTAQGTRECARNGDIRNDRKRKFARLDIGLEGSLKGHGFDKGSDHCFDGKAFG